MSTPSEPAMNTPQTSALPALLLVAVTAMATVAATTSLTTSLTAQQLRRGVASASVLAVGKCVRVQPAGNFVLYQLKLREVLRGEEFLKLEDGGMTDRATVIVLKRVSQHNKPAPAKLRLYCLHDHSRQASKMELPAGFAPYFRMSGFPGTNPDLSEPLDKDPVLGLARILVAAHKGAAPRKVSEQVFTIALHGSPQTRNEALRVLSESEVLLGYLNQVQMRDLLGRAVGETDDIPYKVALCDLCATKRVKNLVDRLCISVQQTGDERFLRALGRIAKYLHQEQAVHVLMGHITRARGKSRDRLIYVLGATSTDSALKELLRMRTDPKDRVSIDAALRVHGAPQALKAIKEPR